jgi:hypothetical protein
LSPSLKVDLVGVGLNATDTLIRLPRYPMLGSKVEFRSAHILPGGQVATAVAARAQWGMRTGYVGKVGDDSAADIFAPSSIASVSRLISSQRRNAPASKQSSWSMMPANAPCYGNATTN